MTYNAECWKRRLAVLVIATSWLTGCATVGFDRDGVAACPPELEYSAADQDRAADELEDLPERAVVVRMLSGYAVMRDQTRACSG